jgi:hypothetical protein
MSGWQIFLIGFACGLLFCAVLSVAGDLAKRRL